MAWPLTRYLDFFANASPSIKALFLNATQDAINGLFGGTLSVKAMKIDGVGGVTVGSPVDGSLIVSRTTMGTPAGAAPRTTGTSAGELTRGLVPMARGKIAPNGTILQGVGIYDVTHTAGSGLYTITLTRAPTSTDNFDVALGMFDWNDASNFAFAQWAAPSIAASRITFKVRVYGMAGPGLTDEAFSFVAYGE